MSGAGEEGRTESLLRTLVISLACLAVGLGIIVVTTFMPDKSLPREVLQEFATILTISGGVGVVLDVFTRRSLLKGVESSLGTLLAEIRTQLERVAGEASRVAHSNEVAQRAEAAGLKDVISTNQVLNPLVESRLRQAAEITIVMNDGRTWISWMQQALRKRIANPDLNTRFILLDPECDMMSIQGRKEGRQERQVREKVETSIAVIANMVSELRADGRVEIWGQNLYTTHTLWLDPDVAVVALYNMAPGLADTMAFSFENNLGDGESIYRALRADVEALLSGHHVRLLYPAKPNPHDSKSLDALRPAAIDAHTQDRTTEISDTGARHLQP